MDELCKQPEYLQWVFLIFLALADAWLGRTDKTKANSVLEFLVLVISSMTKRVLHRRK